MTVSKRLRLPVSFEDALSGLLKVKPPEKPQKLAAKAAKKRKTKER
jgi:hypothetical protein